MSIDLKHLKAGDTVAFRCGGEAVIKEAANEEGTDYKKVRIGNYDFVYFLNGFYEFSGDHPFDIIEIRKS